MDDRESFQNSRTESISKNGSNTELKELTHQWFMKASDNKYSYNFDWLGLPIIQFPQDILAIQEVIYKTKPDIIIETGVARGGSLVLSASLLQLINNNGKVIGIDIDIRPHNRQAIEDHPLSKNIVLIEGSSISNEVLEEIKKYITDDKKVMVILDSNHTHEHVLMELELYSPFVTKNCYLVVMDTVVEDMPDNYFPDRPWGRGNNPKTAVHEFLSSNQRFEIDKQIQDKLLITVAPDGYLKCIK